MSDGYVANEIKIGTIRHFTLILYLSISTLEEQEERVKFALIRDSSSLYQRIQLKKASSLVRCINCTF